jgi:hypothetical protein
MLGAIVGDIIGSSYEFEGLKSTTFPLFTSSSRFTDDTVLTVAVADCLLHDRDYAKTFKEYGERYPLAGYLKCAPRPYCAHLRVQGNFHDQRRHPFCSTE